MRAALRQGFSTVSVVAILASGVAAQEGERPCPDLDADLQLILQSEGAVQTSELFAGMIEGDELVAEPGWIDLYVGIVSQLPPESGGVQGWTLVGRITGDIHPLYVGTEGTAAAGVSAAPPGLVDRGFENTQIFDRDRFGLGIVSGVVLSFWEPVTLDPVGTASITRVRIAGENGATGVFSVLEELLPVEDGGVASRLPCCSEATVAGATYPFACFPELTIEFVESNQRCATPPDDALKPLDIAWERSYEFNASGTYLAPAGDGGLVVCGDRIGVEGHLLKVDADGEVVWRRTFNDERSFWTAASASAADGGFGIVGRSFRPGPGLEKDLYLAKTDSEGIVEWALHAGEANRDEEGRAVASVSDGGLVAVGPARSGFPEYRIYLVRTDASGNPLVDRKLDDTDDSRVPWAVREVPGEGFAIAGSSGSDGLVLVTDFDGGTLWERSVPTSDAFQRTRYQDVVVTQGGILAVGSENVDVSTRTPSAAFSIASVGSGGALHWQRTLPNSGWIRQAYSAAETADGGYLVAGASTLVASRFYVVKLDDEGNFLWDSEFGERIRPGQGGFAVTADGTPFVSGRHLDLSTRRATLIRLEPTVTGQLPGDINQDGRLDVSDGLCLLDFLFGAGQFFLPCGDGATGNPANLALADGNGDGRVDISDAIQKFSYLFLGGPAHVRGAECIAVEGCPGICTP